MPDSTRIDFRDLPNHLEDEGGEFRMGRDALDSPQVGVTWIRLAPGGSTQGDTGHYHDEQDEVYVVVSGGPVEIRVGEERLELSAGQAVRVGAGVMHGVRNRGEEAILVATSGGLPEGGDDSHPVKDWWEGD